MTEKYTKKIIYKKGKTNSKLKCPNIKIRHQNNGKHVINVSKIYVHEKRTKKGI